MNSRERRKHEAAKHNMARDESLAYLEDRIRDPEKYRRPRQTKEQYEKAVALSAMMMMFDLPST